jgi:hypothetical protein
MSNQQLEEIQQEESDRVLASILGISYEDLLKLDPTIERNEGHDGATYGGIVRFSENSPKEILDKIEGLEKGFDGYYVYIDESFFLVDPSDSE